MGSRPGGKEHRRSQPRLDRRRFLELGVAGAAAGIVPASGLAAQPPESAPPPRPSPAPAPDIDDVIDVAGLPVQSWQEPWTWRPQEWPGQALDLNAVARQVPMASGRPGNRFHEIFSFNGTNPAPTIRVRGDGELRIKLRNLLGLDHGTTVVGPASDPVELPPAVEQAICDAVRERGIVLANPDPCDILFEQPEPYFEITGARRVPSWAVAEHANGNHSRHVTNLHTHGLHVTPNANPDGTQSDNVLVRLLSREDWRARRETGDPALQRFEQWERVGEVDYVYHLGDVMRKQARLRGEAPWPQPPGTHWYHPHSHGSTHDQVASGMAGFLILEGDVDEAIRREMTGDSQSDPDVAIGPWDYRERQILVQRIELASLDHEAGPRSAKAKRFPFESTVNGMRTPGVAFVRPGATERWRVLNASVDGRGFLRFMVLEGQFVHDGRHLWRVVADDAAPGGRRLERADRADVAAAKMPLWQLAWDGVTLVEETASGARYTIRDLSLQNADTESPRDRRDRPGADPLREELARVEDCFRDGDSIRAAWVRPNEVLMGNANRADLFFKVPLDAGGKVYTIFGQEVQLLNDNYQQRLQWQLTGKRKGDVGPIDIVVGYLHVRGDAVAGGDRDIGGLVAALPPVPPFLQPVSADELRIPADEARRRGVEAGAHRTRVLGYSGWGSFEAPLVEVPVDFAASHPELENLRWGRHDGTRVLLAPRTTTMAVNSRFDLRGGREPEQPRKFSPHDETHPRVLVESAEEWVLYNNSITCWSHTDTERFPQAGQYNQHFRAYPIGRAEGQRRFARDPEFQITSKGMDHPFHIHINPCWVMRIEIPDENGRLHNILAEPRWMDTLWIPRNGGRVVFRTRFADYTGRWIHHCHVLMHEDNGMMQVIDSVERPEDSDSVPRDRVAEVGMTAAEVDAIYPRPDPALMYRQSAGFVDPNPTTGQVYPGFRIEVPDLEAEEAEREGAL